MHKAEIKNISVHALDDVCSGCTACYNICPTKAIQMTQNAKGFYIPKVNEDQCVQCGLCQRVCQIDKENDGAAPLYKYGAVNTNESVILRSSSGGLFRAVAEMLAEKHKDAFHCFGVTLDETMSVYHAEARDVEGCSAFTGSKYVQSQLSDVFTQIGTILKAGEFVLFTGTGCQCAGLKRYLSAKGVDDTNLLLVDLICHGVPSEKLWTDYIRALEDEYEQKITAYRFRNKQEGWHGLHPQAILADGTVAPRDKLLLSYGRLFGNLSLNEACYHCKYANTKRQGDITLGDYWGIENSKCPFDQSKGVSLCLVNTAKGERWFLELSDRVKTYSIEDDSYLQPQLRCPTGKNVLCDDFWKDYGKKGYRFVAEKYTGHSRFHRALMKLCAVLKKR